MSQQYYARRSNRPRRTSTEIMREVDRKAAQAKKQIPAHTQRPLPDRVNQSPWGNYSYYEYTPAAGVTAQELRDALALAWPFCTKRYTVEGDVVIEECYFSIGD